MKQEDIQDALDLLEDDFIKGTEQLRKKKTKIKQRSWIDWKCWKFAAACFCGILLIATISQIHESEPSMEDSNTENNFFNTGQMEAQNGNYTAGDKMIAEEGKNDVIKTFSYKEVIGKYTENTPGVSYDGFQNLEPVEMEHSEDVIEQAKKECTISYNQIAIAYDKETDMWCVTFFTLTGEMIETVGGDQSIYLDGNGITHLIINGE